MSGLFEIHSFIKKLILNQPRNIVSVYNTALHCTVQWTPQLVIHLSHRELPTGVYSFENLNFGPQPKKKKKKNEATFSFWAPE